MVRGLRSLGVEAGRGEVAYQLTPGYLNGNSASFYVWGTDHGTWHPVGSGYTPQPGDVAVYGLDTNAVTAVHVAVVTADTGNDAAPDVVNGDGDRTGYSVVEVGIRAGLRRREGQGRAALGLRLAVVAARLVVFVGLTGACVRSLGLQLVLSARTMYWSSPSMKRVNPTTHMGQSVTEMVRAAPRRFGSDAPVPAGLMSALSAAAPGLPVRSPACSRPGGRSTSSRESPRGPRARTHGRHRTP